MRVPMFLVVYLLNKGCCLTLSSNHRKLECGIRNRLRNLLLNFLLENCGNKTYERYQYVSFGRNIETIPLMLRWRIGFATRVFALSGSTFKLDEVNHFRRIDLFLRLDKIMLIMLFCLNCGGIISERWYLYFVREKYSVIFNNSVRTSVQKNSITITKIFSLWSFLYKVVSILKKNHTRTKPYSQQIIPQILDLAFRFQVKIYRSSTNPYP